MPNVFIASVKSSTPAVLRNDGKKLGESELHNTLRRWEWIENPDISVTVRLVKNIDCDKTEFSRIAQSCGGFTLIEVLVIAATLIALFAFLIPQMVQEKRRTVCKKNLVMIAVAFKTWSLDSRDRYMTEAPVAEGGTLELINSGQVFVHFRALFTNTLNPDPKVLVCPADSKKKPAKDFLRGLSDENVSYLIGADADDNFPGAILSGDRNLAIGGVPLRPGLTVTTTNSDISWTRAIHHSCGNVLLSDGSVQFLNSAQLKMAVRSQGIATNRLLIP